MDSNLQVQIENSKYLFCFSVDEYRFAVNLVLTERVCESVEIQQVPGSHPLMMGLVNYHGQIIPALDFRWRLGLPLREFGLNDYFILFSTSVRKFFIVANAVQGVTEVIGHQINTDVLINSSSALTGVYQTDDGLYYIYDLEQFISGTENILIEESMSNAMNLPEQL
jgi:purine-binding chemotaxis protein CheW